MTRRPRFDHEHSVQAPSSTKPDDTRCMGCRAGACKRCRAHPTKGCTCTHDGPGNPGATLVK